ncbi:NAD regulator [Parvularcula sp. ZS-1/3]|uniref:NAD regulator n=1 Tax=Parvularcula mediterranea TaxID=2732508 RepID=A0A7Y3W4B4_9PROT|nr:NAD regulator [Parvularcula mediterranea]
MERRLVIGLNIALTTLIEGEPHVLCVKRAGGWGLPFGRFDPEEHRTFELAMRDFVERQTAVPLGYVEQLYTFGDKGREAPRASLRSGDEADRIVSVGYLALSPEPTQPQLESAAWRPWYAFFPWEDQREEGADLREDIAEKLRDWAAGDDEKLDRIAQVFCGEDQSWSEERALDRYELMYEAQLVTEAHRDRDGVEGPLLHGEAMISDHRRILATAIGRLRGKLRYRPVIFNLIPAHFTLGTLQVSVEAILGFSVHKQNFRRGVEGSELVSKTGETSSATGGRPAALYEPGPAVDAEAGSGLPLPRLKLSAG